MSIHICAELGINHSGSLETALRMVQAAKDCGATSVKFQKRVPRIAVPPEMWDVPRETPWGVLPYIEYKERIEFSVSQYQVIDQVCRTIGIPWFVSVWDIPSLDEMLAVFPDMPYIKVPSACLTDDALLQAIADTDKPIIVSTGMSTPQEIDHAMGLLTFEDVTVCHCNSTYPCPPKNLNLRCLTHLKDSYPWATLGYSGHEVGLAPSLAAAALGAQYIERHFTLDRSSWGTDQAASVEPGGFRRLVKDIRLVETSLGDGIKRVYDEEVPVMRKLRRVYHAGQKG